MYENWIITRWETPVVDVRRLLLVSLVDANRELTLLFEDPRAPGRPRWRVRFRDYPAYRNIDEAYRTELWRRLDQSGQRCGSTFTVEESPRLVSWGTGWLDRPRHFVLATDDDVVEVLSLHEPVWEAAEPAPPGDPMPGKSTHLYLGEDDTEIRQLGADLRQGELGAASPVVEAEVTLLPTEEGGRSSALCLDHAETYRPHVVVGDVRQRATVGADGVGPEEYLGVRFRRVDLVLAPGSGGRVCMDLMYYPEVTYERLLPGATFTLREGGRVVGFGKVLRRSDSGSF